ncbi:MAG: glyoxalase/bleomycin resistance/dioxygenase family protein [Gammaproteobacteria bacterium]|nr:glyoxalase/bleomycin resistance/dioxygenase family protein [Gammaproteobacteria bacterium]
MPGPARAGTLIYAKDPERLSVFYQGLLGMRRLHADAEHHVIESADMQLIIHAIPPQIAATIDIASPPEPRAEQAIKLFFTVPSLTGAATVADALGGALFGPEYAGPGFRARNGYDPEGNIFHVREPHS